MVSCHAIDKSFYPIGICGASNTNAFPALQAAGFNLVLGSSSKSYLNAADKHGLKVWAGVGLTSSNVNYAKTRDIISKSDRHPALWSWFLADEPEMNGISPERVQQAHRFVKKCRARKPTSVVIFRGDAVWDYSDISDVVFCDRYPIPWMPISDFRNHLRMIRYAIGPEKPLYAVIQAFDWEYYRYMLGPKVGPLRSPTCAEMRCMVYIALTQGVDGILFYSYDDGPGKWQMQEHPETWDSVCKIVAEINQRLPLFTAEHVWWPKRHWFDYTGRRYDAALEASVQSVLLNVRDGNDKISAGHYVVAVNTTDQEQIYSFVPPFERVVKFQVHAENRTLVPKDNWLSDTFKPFEIHVYGPMEPADRQPEDGRRRIGNSKQ